MKRFAFGMAALAAALALSTAASAMPNFARKYGVECSTCHSAVPKLNRFGFEFRNAGYRMPSDIGKEEEKFNLGDFFTARFQSQFVYKKHSDVKPGKDTNSNQLEFFEATLYPLTGSWGKNFASIGELSMSPDDVFEIENAFVRGAFGDKDGWFQARIGIMHPWEGSGASDRPLGISRPLIQKVPAVGSPFFLWNLDESAAEVGYYFANSGTTLTARISNGILWKEDGSGTAEPAQGGALSKPKDQPGANAKNFQVFINQFIKGETAGLSLYYYHGVVPFPDPNYSATTDTTEDTFQRLALYGNVWTLSDKLNILAGYAFGHDSLDDPTVASSDGKYSGSKVGDSSGFFGELNYHVDEKLAFGGRFDLFDPSDQVDNNNQTAETLFVNYSLFNGLQLMGEYQHKDTEQSAGGSNKDDQATARMIFIW
jgi:hypothetical protein